ncbi:MAG: response regulator transcription factor [Bacteroidales bacterium]
MENVINVMIVDDEPSCILNLVNDLAIFPFIKIMVTVTSAIKAEQMIVKLQPDVLFLDIEMPEKNGIELLNDISKDVHLGMQVVFYSAFDKYMIDAIRASAFDYLLKPYQQEELVAIINRIKDKKNQQCPLNFEQSIRRMLANDKFAVQTLTGLLLVKQNEVFCFQYQPELRCWQIVLATAIKHKLRTTTKAGELLKLSNTFAQITPTCILNLEYLATIENGSLKCILLPPFQDLDFTISRRCYSKLKERLEIV